MNKSVMQRCRRKYLRKRTYNFAKKIRMVNRHNLKLKERLKIIKELFPNSEYTSREIYNIDSMEIAKFTCEELYLIQKEMNLTEEHHTGKSVF